MRRTLIVGAALFAASWGAASAHGVGLKAIVHREGAGPMPCRASVTRALSFAYDPLSGTGQVATAVVTLICHPAQYLSTIEISSGHANQFGRYREMWRDGSDGSQVLKYNFYTTAGYNVVWGDGTGGSSPTTVAQNVTTYNALIFARLDYAQSSVAAGRYSDDVTVTFNI